MFPQRDYINATLTAGNILKKVSSLDIFKFYVGKFTPNKVFNSPLRKDKKPSFAIQKFNGEWFFKDFSTGDSGNCFKFVQRKYSCDFKGSLNRINLDFNLGLDNSVTLPGEYVQINAKPDFIKKRTIIQVKSRQWTQVDKNYWEPFGISKEILELYEVKPLSHYWINEHSFTVRELCYAYRFGSNLYKIYYPLRTSDKWYSNVTSNIIQGYNQLEYRKDQLVITKSLKDVMVLRSVGIEAIAPQAESVLLNQSQINYFRKKYRKIYCLYDWDRAGRHLAWLCRNNYGIEPIKFSDSTNLWVMKQGYMGCKDISDFVKVHGKEEFLTRVNSF